MRTVRGCVLALLLLSARPPVRLSAQDSTRISEAQAVLAPLVESYGVSGTEGPVRETVKRLLPAWATPSTDTAGNLWVRVGQGNPVVVFVAHLDEIGFRVTGIRESPGSSCRATRASRATPLPRSVSAWAPLHERPPWLGG